MLRSSKPGIACKSDGGFDSRPPPPPGSSTLARPGFDEVNATHRSERPVQVPHGRERPRVTSSDLAAVLCSSGPIGSYPRSDGAVKSRLVGCGVSSVSTARHDEAQPESHRSPSRAKGSRTRRSGRGYSSAPRTVQYHLRKVFTKLSITSRVQLESVLPPNSMPSEDR